MTALGGFQLLEEHLKNYIEVYYKSVRHLLNSRLHFDYSRSDIDDAPLGRLISIFAKVCSNTNLVNELRLLVKERNKAAHSALLCLYKTDTTDHKFHEMIRLNHKMTDKVSDTLSELNREFDAMQKSVFRD